MVNSRAMVLMLLTGCFEAQYGASEHPPCNGPSDCPLGLVCVVEQCAVPAPGYEPEQSHCGDGIVSAGEDCDDANDLESDACLNNCRMAQCGDGITRSDLQPDEPGYEECDDGAEQPGAACQSCRIERIEFTLQSVDLQRENDDRYFAMGQFGGEGLPDLLLRNSESILDPAQSLGPEGFVEAPQVRAGTVEGGHHQPALIDVDGDGQLEVLAGANNDSGFKLFEFLEGDEVGLELIGGLRHSEGGRSASEFYFFVNADVDGDGAEEALGISPDSQASLFTFQPENALRFSRQDFPCGSHSKGGFAYINDDDLPDIYVICDGGTLRWFLNEPVSGFPSEPSGRYTVSDLAECNATAALDLDGDGRDELVLIRRASGASSVGDVILLPNGGAGFTSQQTLEPHEPAVWRGLLAHDLSGDGRSDLVVYGGDGAQWWLNDGQGRLQGQGLGLRGRLDLIDVEVADVDGDGDADLVAIAGGQLHLMLNGRIPQP